ncbi:DUF1109 domain-containing protein [Nocardia araoensis]|uniref:DUF1109 domain-containing protein n=1 Tax=Nocardia araoensis TaxID=228600 RepID=UPI001FE12D40|nr:DUF1109 domain-containing protein [Nocardia araoensis]
MLVFETAAARYFGPVSNREPLVRALIEQDKPNRAPGPIHLAFTFVPVAVLVCLYYDWWPSRYGSSAWVDPLLFGAAAVLVLLVCGAVWAVRTLHAVGRDRTRSWWMAAAPALILAVAGTVTLLPRPSFEATRPQFEQVALDLLASSEPSRSQFEIGRFDISYARKDPDGTVYFIEGGGLGLTVSSGWAYSPHGTPVGFDDFTATHLGGPWYEFTAVWRS